MQAGLDSLAAVDLRNAIASRFSISVAPTLAFDFPTLRALGQHIAMRMTPAKAVEQSKPPGLHPNCGDRGSMQSLVLAVGCKYPGSSQGDHKLTAPAIRLLNSYCAESWSWARSFPRSGHTEHLLTRHASSSTLSCHAVASHTPACWKFRAG